MKKLAIVTTHPIQYNAPWFRLLNERGVVRCKVFYTWHQAQDGAKYDPDFKKVIQWDIPLLEGYEYTFVHNISKTPGSHHFKGIDNPTLIEEIVAWQPDVVLVIGWAYKSHLRSLRYFKGKKPVLFRGDSTLLDESKGIKVLVRRIFLKWVYRHVDKVLYVGTNNKRYFEIHGLKEAQLVQALHAIDIERFHNVSVSHLNQINFLRKQLNIKADSFVILFAGKLERKKNPFFLLELAKRMEDPEMVFLIIGNGELENDLKNKASNDHRIKFLDFQNQRMMPVIYSLSSLFILPSRGPGETWGLAANEAMACGLPVIMSSKAGGALDLIKNNGFIFDKDDVDGVKNYIEQLRQYPAKYQLASQASLQHSKCFDFLQIVKAVEKACN